MSAHNYPCRHTHTLTNEERPLLFHPSPETQVLNTLQMWAKSSDRMTYMDVKGRMGGIDKDKTLRCVLV